MRSPVVALIVALVLPGCSLEEISLVESEDVVIAEVYVELAPGAPGNSRATAWLHRTLDGGAPSSRPVPGAQVLITSTRNFSLELAEAPQESCVWDTPEGVSGTCYATTADMAARFLPGELLRVEVSLPDGRELTGASTVPGGFDLAVQASDGRCRALPETPLTLRWSPSEGAWAYVNEALISGLRAALAPRGIEVDRDPFYLLGLSVSAADTSIVFPGEFGVFERFDLDQGLARSLQEGLPANTVSTVVITAADRNYVNWIRGGNFNPSGLVKIPSMRGDGTGVFATTVSRRIQVTVPGPGGDLPLCARE
jgi:hypothetical protein